MSTIETIQAALQALHAGYLANDAEAIDSATAELDRIGQVQLAVAALDPLKRKAIERLAGEWAEGGTGRSFVTQWHPTDWTMADIARAVVVAEAVVQYVVGEAEAVSERLLREQLRADDAEDEADWAKAAARRASVREVPCTSCGAEPGAACVSSGGKPNKDSHAARRRDRDAMPGAGNV